MMSPIFVPTGIGSSAKNNSDSVDIHGLVLVHDVAVAEARTQCLEGNFGEVPVAGATGRTAGTTTGHRERAYHLAIVDHAQAPGQGGQHRIVPVGRAAMSVVFLTLPELHDP